jgi:hypothetical protein
MLYRTRHEFEHLSVGVSAISARSIDGDYLPENGFGLFYLGKLGHLKLGHLMWSVYNLPCWVCSRAYRLYLPLHMT